MESENIIRALECCKTSALADCKQCTYKGKADCEEDLGITCLNVLLNDSLILIKELTEENERLREQVKMWTSTAYCEKDRNESIKADTVRKMQERFNEKVAKLLISPSIQYQASAFIDQIAKEMLEGDNEQRKQIEEMAKICHFYDDGICHLCEELLVSCDRKCDLAILVENLYNAGYRKASNFVGEIFEEIEDVINNIGYFDELDFEALKKKYIGTEDKSED